MPYKIIETIECGRRLIASVPSLWESDGNLYWPKKNLMSLKKNENSTPQSDWKCLPCILKRDNIVNYKTAEEEVAVMSDYTDTDEKENECPQKKTSITFNLNNLAEKCIQKSKLNEESCPMPPASATSAMAVEDSSLRKVAEETSSVVVAEKSPIMKMANDMEVVMVATDSFSLIPAENASSIIVVAQESSMEMADDTVEVTAATDSSSLITAKNASSIVVTADTSSTTAAKNAPSIIVVEDSSSIMWTESNAVAPEDLNNINKQNHTQKITSITPIVQDNIQDEMLQPDLSQHLPNIISSSESPQNGVNLEIMLTTILENQKVLFDNQQHMLKGLALLNTKIEEFFARLQGPPQHVQQDELSRFKAITNIKELMDFEELLEDSTMVTKYFEELSICCSVKKSGYNNAYSLVDAMFDRKFMTLCSWGGGTKGEPKHCFKAYPKTINLFLKIVNHYDKTFSKPICEDFFKNVLRHSVKRNAAKRARNSTMKKKNKRSEVAKEPENT